MLSAEWVLQTKLFLPKQGQAQTTKTMQWLDNNPTKDRKMTCTQAGQ